MWRRLFGKLFWRIFWIFIAWVIGTASTFFFKEEVFRWLMIPADGRLSPFPGGLPVFMQPAGALSATFSVASRGGLITAFPVAVYSFYTLLAPILPSRYKLVYLVVIPISTAFFVAGTAFTYYVMMPRMLAFLLSFGEGVAIPLISIEEYLGLLFSMAFWLGIIFQIPLIMFILAKMDIIGYRRFRRIRRATAIFAIIMAIIITPTFDGITMALMAIPIYVVYELGLFLAWAARPDRGNYLWLGSLARAIRKVFRVIRAIVYSPYTVPRWLFRKVTRLWR